MNAYAVFGFTLPAQQQIARLIQHGNAAKLSEGQMIQSLTILARQYKAQGQVQDFHAALTLIDILFKE